MNPIWDALSEDEEYGITIKGEKRNEVLFTTSWPDALSRVDAILSFFFNVCLLAD